MGVHSAMVTSTGQGIKTPIEAYLLSTFVVEPPPSPQPLEWWEMHVSLRHQVPEYLSGSLSGAHSVLIPNAFLRDGEDTPGLCPHANHLSVS